MKNIVINSIVIVVVVLVFALGLYLTRMQVSKLDDALVREYYLQHINATRSFDAKTLCDLYDKSFRITDIGPDPNGNTTAITLNRKQACAATRESMQLLHKTAKASQEVPDLTYTIESITLSPDERRATVKVRASMRIGKRFSLTSTGTETLVRRFGKVRSLGGESRTSIATR